jgi:hypothetical protein
MIGILTLDPCVENAGGLTWHFGAYIDLFIVFIGVLR